MLGRQERLRDVLTQIKDTTRFACNHPIDTLLTICAHVCSFLLLQQMAYAGIMKRPSGGEVI